MNATVPEFPPPRVPITPVLSFADLLTKPRGLELPTVADAGPALMLTSGRVALATALELMSIDAGDQVLIPAYNCSSMVEPILWKGATPVLYKVNPDLSCDLSDIATRINDSVRCVVIVHYFGFPQRLDELRSLCDRHGTYLLEDCAHALIGSFEGEPPGSVGDVAIASPMKFFPIYDGGLLVSRSLDVRSVNLHRAGPGFQIKALINNMEKSFHYNRLRPLGWLLAIPLWLKDRLWARAKRANLKLAEGIKTPGAFDGGFDFDPAWMGVGMSSVSRWLLARVSVKRVAEKRRENYRRLAEAFSDLSGCRSLYPVLADGVVPYMFPLIVDRAVDVFPVLKARGVPIYRWESVQPEPCRVSAEYSLKLFQLPCHQEMTPSEIDWLISEVTSATAQ